jgi:hypothetical protein
MQQQRERCAGSLIVHLGSVKSRSILLRRRGGNESGAVPLMFMEPSRDGSSLNVWNSR